MATPIYHAPQDTLTPTPASPDDINQFLGEHAAPMIYDGALIGGTRPLTYGTQASLLTTGISQVIPLPLTITSGDAAGTYPFLDIPIVLNGTELDRLDVAYDGFIGQAPYLQFDLYADSAGQPTGSSLGTIVMPPDTFRQPSALPAAAGSPACRAIPVLLGSTSIGTTLPNIRSPGMATDGLSFVLLMGGISQANMAQTSCFVGVLNDSNPSGVSVFTQTSDLTQATIFPSSCAVTDSSGTYVVMAGGAKDVYGPDYYDNVFSAVVSPTGLTSWIAQPSLPQPAYLGLLVYRNGYLYYIGGYTATTDTCSLLEVATANVYYATFTNGTIGAWTQTDSLPTNDDGITVGGVTSTGDIVAGVNNETVTESMWYTPRINAATGAIDEWLPIGTTSTPVVIFGQCVAGNTIAIQNVLTEPNVMLIDSPQDYAPFVTSTMPPYLASATCCATANGLFTFSANAVMTATVATPLNLTTYTQIINEPLLSVPLSVSGLTSGDTYHVVITAPVPSLLPMLISVPLFLFGATADGLAAAFGETITGPWFQPQSSPPCTIDIQAYTNGTPPQGRVRAILEDVSEANEALRYTLIDYLGNGQLTQILEVTQGTVRLMAQQRVLQYNPDLTLDKVT
jgi:hypothetical protein